MFDTAMMTCGVNPIGWPPMNDALPPPQTFQAGCCCLSHSLSRSLATDTIYFHYICLFDVGSVVDRLVVQASSITSLHY